MENEGLDGEKAAVEELIGSFENENLVRRDIMTTEEYLADAVREGVEVYGNDV